VDTTRPSLLLRIRDPSDAAAWRAFDEVYRPMLYRFGRACGLHDDEAEDVAQQCLVTVADKIAAFEYDPQTGRFKSWLRTLVNNRVRSLMRKRAVATAHEKQPRNGNGNGAAPAADDAFERIWLEEHLWHCLRALRNEVDERTYRAYEAYVIEERPLDDVCAELGLKPNNVYTIKWRLTQRVAGKMRELLNGGFEAEAGSVSD
jgi:RNA polymerase sigma factor (sigma-70 family)